jgi:hypothetical protein
MLRDFKQIQRRQQNILAFMTADTALITTEIEAVVLAKLRHF